MASPWATPEDLRVHLRLDSIDTADAEAALAAAEDVIRAGLGQSVDQALVDTVHLTGNGRTVLLLPEVPVTAVTSVTIDGTALDADGYRWNREGILTRLCGVWPLDADVQVVHDHGNEPIPAAVSRVCVQVAGRAWVNPQNVEAETMGDRSVTYSKSRNGEELTAYEQTLLARYGSGYGSR